MFTKAQKDTWLARLRDPKAVQYRGGYTDIAYVGPDDDDMPRCCIAHAAYAVAGSTSTYRDFPLWQNLEKVPYPKPIPKNRGKISFKDYLVHLNDVEKLTLPEIANKIEKYLPTKD
jgi:hypothetical protein